MSRQPTSMKPSGIRPPKDERFVRKRAKRHIFLPSTLSEGDEDRGQAFGYAFHVHPGREYLLASSLPTLAGLSPALPPGVVPRIAYWRLKFHFEPDNAPGPVGVTTHESFWGAAQRRVDVAGFQPAPRFKLFGQGRLPAGNRTTSTSFGVDFQTPYPAMPSWGNLYLWYLHKTPGDELSWDTSSFTPGTIRIAEGELGLIY